MREQNELFSTIDFGNGVYHTCMPGKTPGPGRVYSSLIVGDKAALLIDTGYGIGEYRNYVESLTDKPIIVVNSHGHIDHAGGNPEFEEVWLNPLDYALADWHTTLEMRINSKVIDRDDLFVTGDYHRLPLEDGVSFDLGGRTVTAHRCAGHTEGSMSFLDSKTKYLFTGDNITRRVLLIGETTLREFIDTLDYTKTLDFDQIVAAHVPYRMPKTWIDKVKAIAEGFDPAKGKPAICFSISMPGLEAMEYTVGTDFDDPDYCGFVYNALQLDAFLA